MNVLIILGHPRTESFCGAMARAYRQGAAAAPGVQTRFVDLAELVFDIHVRRDSPEDQALEADLCTVLESIEWADHLVFVYPTWWGTMPALLKGFLDRMVMPGHAFRFYGPGATEWEALWQGKTGQIITTMDTPPAVYRLIFRAPGNHAMRNATLGFCGVKPVRTFICGPVRTSDTARRWRWLARVHRLGRSLEHGVRSPFGRGLHRTASWLRALRLQFYPMTWAAYTLGAFAAATTALDMPRYVAGYLFLFALEAATVFCNETIDYPSDRDNRNHGPFTGGSRVLVDASIGFNALRRAIAIALTAALVGAVFLLQDMPHIGTPLAWLSAAFVLTLGYTVAPLKLCYRSLGELDVAFTHSALVVMLGYIIQGGHGLAPAPWLVSLPLALAILPAIILAGIPDRHADAGIGKQTIVVRLGARPALAIAAIAVITSALIVIGYDLAHIEHGLFAGIAYPVIVHAALCLWLLGRLGQRLRSQPAEVGRIDTILVVMLNYMLWFVAIPLYWLAFGG